MKKRLSCLPGLLLAIFLPLQLFAQPFNVPGGDNSQPRTSLSWFNYVSAENAYAVDTDLEIIRKRIIDDLLEAPINQAQISELVKTIRQDGSWPGINYQDVSRTGFQHSRHLENMFELSRALKKPGSPFYTNAEVKRTVSSALDFWIANDFICENWWWNEMGTPNLMINTLLVLDTDLTETQRREGARIANRANLQASGARPGGDLIQIAGMLGKQGLFARNDTIVDKVVKVMADEIKVTTGRGLKPDMSFHHRVDNVISTLTYGTGYANAFSYWTVKIAGTKYKLPEQSMKLLIDYYLDGICKSMVYASFPDPGAMNRDLSRRAALAPVNSRLPENLLQASDYRKLELQEVVGVRKGEKKPQFSSNRFFWHSSYFTHQRPSYFASVRMHSSRAFNIEQPHNEEGLKNHHFADGSNFISRSGKEYFDIFPVWDWQKIPGTTVVQKPALPHWREIPKKGRTDFSGAVSDGKYGVAAFDFVSPHDSLKARKAWFFFDKEYVCLGTAISSGADYPVATTINQCLLSNDVLVKNQNKPVKLAKGKKQLNGVSWVYHDSVAYIFPSPQDIMVANTTATGNWRQINHQAWATEDPVTKEVFTLWLDHGLKSRNAGYEYIVVPGIQAPAIDAYVKKDNISVLSNTANIQAVKNKTLNITQAVFYQPGKIKINEKVSIGANEPCIVMVKMKGAMVIEIAVSDPTQKLSKLQLTLNTVLTGKGKEWYTSADASAKSTLIHIQLPRDAYAGKTVVLQPNR